jgi:parallel beta helix pectate lyase-like protein
VRTTLCAFLAFCCAASALGAQRSFVSAANGDDANSCTRAFPCRNFAAAIPATDVNGEVVVLDSGGYGVVTITKPLSIISPRGVYAGITATSGDAITVNAGDTAHVVLSNLNLISLGAQRGISSVTGAAALYVSGCDITGFDRGIFFWPVTAAPQLHVRETTVRGSFVGISIGADARAMVTRARLFNNSYGVSTYANAVATIYDSTAGSCTDAAFQPANTSKMMVVDSVASTSHYGFKVSEAVMVLTRCTATSGTVGVSATFGANVYVSDSTIAFNGFGVIWDAPTFSQVRTRGNNILQANDTNGSFSGSFGAD